MTLSEAAHSIGQRVVLHTHRDEPQIDHELHGVIRYVGLFVFVLFDHDRYMTPKAVASELLFPESEVS